MYRYVLTLSIMLGTPIPGLAQPSSATGHEKQIIDEIARKWEIAFNHKDAAGVAALCTENTVEVDPSGIIRGRDAVEKRLEHDFTSGAGDLSIDVQVAYSAGDTILSAGEWRSRYGERQMHGYWSTVSVYDGTQWKHRQNAFNVDSSPSTKK